jgi:hypothetical protein
MPQKVHNECPEESFKGLNVMKTSRNILDSGLPMWQEAHSFWPGRNVFLDKAETFCLLANRPPSQQIAPKGPDGFHLPSSPGK